MENSNEETSGEEMLEMLKSGKINEPKLVDSKEFSILKLKIIEKLNRLIDEIIRKEGSLRIIENSKNPSLSSDEIENERNILLKKLDKYETITIKIQNCTNSENDVIFLNNLLSYYFWSDDECR